MTLNRRRLVGGGLTIVASLLVAASTASVAAAPSRASNRWNHTPAAANVSSDASGIEPIVKGPVWKVIRLTETYSARFQFVDVAPKGDSPGDFGVFRDPVFNATGDKVGTIDAQCIAAYSDQCTGSIRLAGRGQITFSGITALGVDPDHYAVTGGTGEFAGIGGVLLIQFPDFDRASLTLTLTR